MHKVINKKDLIIIIQAPHEIIYALTLYEKYHKNTNLSIAVVKIKSSYQYLETLNLNLSSLLFIPYPKIKSFYSLHSLINLKLAINRAINDNFSHVRNAQIYFFGNAFDYFTIPILLNLKANNECTFLSSNAFNNDLNAAKNLNQYRIKDYLLLIIFWWLSGHKLDISIRNVILLIPEKHSIKFKLINDNPAEVLNKYSKVFEFKKPSILFFESPSASISISNYQEVLLKIISLLNKQDINIYIKPHPQKGYSSFLEKTNVIILNQNIPGELINTQNINLILGINSSSIIKIAKKSPELRVFSLVELFSFYDSYNFVKTNARNIIDNSTGIEIIHNIDDFEKIIKSIK
jgi:hypothetical protein